MMVQSMPNPPDGSIFESADDPHVVATFYSPAGNDLYGLIYNYDRSWVAVVDITKLLAAPNTQTPHVVDPTYDLVANGVITYLPTGYSPGPASNGEARVRGLHRRGVRRH